MASHVARGHVRYLVGDGAGEFILFESQLSRHGAHYEAVATYELD